MTGAQRYIRSLQLAIHEALDMNRDCPEEWKNLSRAWSVDVLRRWFGGTTNAAAKQQPYLVVVETLAQTRETWPDAPTTWIAERFVPSASRFVGGKREYVKVCPAPVDAWDIDWHVAGVPEDHYAGGEP